MKSDSFSKDDCLVCWLRMRLTILDDTPVGLILEGSKRNCKLISAMNKYDDGELGSRAKISALVMFPGLN